MPIKTLLTIALLVSLAAAPLTGHAAITNYIAYPAPRPMPVTHIIGPDNKRIELTSFSGRVVLLTIWATWCAPCRKEMPQLDALQKKYAKEGLSVIAVGMEKGGLDAVRDFLARYALDLKPYADPTLMLGVMLGSDAIPYTVVINRKGQAVGAVRGELDWMNEEAQGLVKAMLAEKA